MSSKKIKDLVVKVGSYTDRNTGQDKSRWETIGAIMQSDDGSMFVMLKRTFNPAGVPGQEARESILVSAFDPQHKGDNVPPRSGDGGQDDYNKNANAGSAGRGSDLNDEVPFAPEWR